MRAETGGLGQQRLVMTAVAATACCGHTRQASLRVQDLPLTLPPGHNRVLFANSPPE